LALLLVVLVVRAALLRPPAQQIPPAPRMPDFDVAAVAENLSAAVREPTVSLRQHGGGDVAAFERLHRVLIERYPRVHATLQRETVAALSLVYRWSGSDSSLAPLLVLGHLDVVPVEPDTEDAWTFPPFGGVIADGFVWGRGTLDDKVGVVGLLEASEHLLAAGFVPRRTIVFAFGHDEEVGGPEGASAIAAKFEAEQLQPWFVLDEGGVAIEGSIPGIEQPVALVGIAEKGHASVELRITGEGGHSSMPPAHGPIARLGAAVQRLEDHPMPTDIRGATGAMITRLAPEMPLLARMALGNLWLFQPAVEWALAGQQASNASVRTTTAVTVFHAGTADNVLPSQARAVVNFRILPGDTVQGVLDHVWEVVDDPEIEVSCLSSCWEASGVSSTTGEAFSLLEGSILQVFPEVVVAPYLVVGATDARHYQRLTDASYRFLPLLLRDEDRSRIHGTDERISVEGLGRAVRFYMTLFINAAG
jgi:carboxypeptidase PM20D1